MSKLSPNEEQKLKDNLKGKGYKLTLQRRAILDIIVKSEGKHLTAEELYDEVKKNALKSVLQQYTERCSCLKRYES